MSSTRFGRGASFGRRMGRGAMNKPKNLAAWPVFRLGKPISEAISL